MPTPDQVRAEVWMALIHDASGLFNFAHEWQPRFREAGLLYDPDMRDGATEATFSLPGRSLSGPVEVIGESRTIVPAASTFHDSFAGYAAHLYRFPAWWSLALPCLIRSST
jgi:hypothetical protein